MLRLDMHYKSTRVKCGNDIQVLKEVLLVYLPAVGLFSSRANPPVTPSAQQHPTTQYVRELTGRVP